MDQASLETILADVHLPAIRFFPTIDSTNDEAWRWIKRGAPNGALVIADEQTAGRGRLNRQWVTAPGCGLAFSIILLAPPFHPNLLSRLTGLGALAATQALRLRYSLIAQIKWPNDILLNDQKAGGVLVDAHWQGATLIAVVIGIGINIALSSVNPHLLPPEAVIFPATCVESAMGHRVDRIELLHAILQELFSWLPRLATQDFIQEWEHNLAYRGQWVELSDGSDAPSSLHGATPPDIIRGKVIGLSEDGSLLLQTSTGKVFTAQVGELHLRPARIPTPD